MKAGKKVEARESGARKIGERERAREREREEKVRQECVGRKWGKRSRESGVSEIGERVG